MNIIQYLTRLIWAEPQTNPYILQLPVEILVDILALLPLHSRLVVYQTCRRLRAVIHEHFPGEKCQDGRDTSQDYRVTKIGWPKYYPSHRHVELTLKYTRMEDKNRRHQRYLQRLLTPHHGSNNAYLLLSIFTYLEGETKVSRESIRFLEICYNISHLETCYFWYGIKRDIDEAFETAISAEGARIFFSCSVCRTEYSIQASPERFIICVWQDFGPEGTMYDPDWMLMAFGYGSVYHKPGSVRGLYGPHEHNGEIY
ncbi:hypothetical protein ACQKWADRAFT_322807 [Trichoderma austrokoningii]